MRRAGCWFSTSDSASLAMGMDWEISRGLMRLLIFVAVPRDKGDGALAGAQHAGHQGRVIRPRRVIEGQLDRSPVVTSVGFEALSQPA